MAEEIEIEIERERERERGIASVLRLSYKSHRGVYQSGIFVGRVPRVLSSSSPGNKRSTAEAKKGTGRRRRSRIQTRVCRPERSLTLDGTSTEADVTRNLYLRYLGSI